MCSVWRARFAHLCVGQSSQRWSDAWRHKAMRARGLAGVFMPSGTGERTFLRIQAESPVDFQKSSAGLRNRYRRLHNERTLGNLACRTSTCSVGKPSGLGRDAESASITRKRSHSRASSRPFPSRMATCCDDFHVIYTTIRRKAHQVHKRNIVYTSPQGYITRLSL